MSLSCWILLQCSLICALQLSIPATATAGQCATVTSDSVGISSEISSGNRIFLDGNPSGIPSIIASAQEFSFPMTTKNSHFEVRDLPDFIPGFVTKILPLPDGINPDEHKNPDSHSGPTDFNALPPPSTSASVTQGGLSPVSANMETTTASDIVNVASQSTTSLDSSTTSSTTSSTPSSSLSTFPYSFSSSPASTNSYSSTDASSSSPSLPSQITTMTGTSATISSDIQRHSTVNLNLILGIVIGILTFIIILVLLLFYLYRRRNRRKEERMRDIIKLSEGDSDFFEQKHSMSDLTGSHFRWALDDASLSPSDSVSQAHSPLPKRQWRNGSPTILSTLSEETEKTFAARSSTEDGPVTKSDVSSTQVQSTFPGLGYGVGRRKLRADADGSDESDDDISDGDSSISSITTRSASSRRRREENPNIPVITMTAATPTPPSTVIAGS